VKGGGDMLIFVVLKSRKGNECVVCSLQERKGEGLTFSSKVISRRRGI